ncbi:hypothetical protein MP477_09500 [Chryseobacterium sp. WG23]|uniref:hypothetical protein n=1 Tax=Chryseobacterium sp. WG23 TaxID=2926910 RepID=UPI00211EC504|nr:hypothetical protein [Chryseobacterium sp. WG23]MCQ9635185.1 hypothetical protein [Chryseobacterium sp. WG23]
MNKKKGIASLILLLAVTAYFVLFYKDKKLRFIPENADAVVLIDVKNLTRQYLFSLITHPSQWGSKTKGKGSVSLRESGITIPDFLQVFHLKGTRVSEWYSVLELKDPQKFIAFLKQQNFASKGKNIFQKDHIFLSIEGGNCIVGTSDSGFGAINKKLFQNSQKNILDADRFIQNTAGSISFLSGQKIHNFSIELKDDEIEIKNNSTPEIVDAIVSKLQQGNHFLEAELNADNIKNYTHFFNINNGDSLQISHFKATADLEQVNDTIISYGYDDNFNEIEKKTYQKIIQPNYIIDFQSRVPEKTWDYFQTKKWINAQNQFTAIPFQPNNVSRNTAGFVIKSTRKPIQQSPKLEKNYIFIRNSEMLFSSLSTLSKAEKRIISDIDYVFYGNEAQNYWVKVKAKNGKLPLILRW